MSSMISEPPSLMGKVILSKLMSGPYISLGFYPRENESEGTKFLIEQKSEHIHARKKF